MVNIANRNLDNATNDSILELPPQVKIVWGNVVGHVYLHSAAAYGLHLFVTGQVLWQTAAWAAIVYIFSFLGITAGVHRYWSHKSFKAKLPLQILLMIMQTIAYQNSIHEWARDHRLHHKYSETNADPHNAKRGFFFAHIGWVMSRKHPAVKEKGKLIDITDLESDPVVCFQKKYYYPLVLICNFLIPVLVPYYVWGESMRVAWHFAVVFRYCLSLHCTFLVNSAAHLWGHRSYDRNINPAENKAVAIFAFGEGWHNYHHVFPWDYKTAELGLYKYNITTAFIDFFAWIGWAYDMKTVSEKVIRDRVRRTGDGMLLKKSSYFTDNIIGSLDMTAWSAKDVTSREALFSNLRD